MEEKRLTDEEIVKALECCTQEPVCNNCPIKDKDYCTKPATFFLEIVKLIKSQKAEIELLSKVIGSSKRKTKILELQKEIERLTIAEKQYLSEIERLNKSCGLFDIKLQEQIKETYDYVHKSDKLKKRNAELQKQVDELKTENTELYKEHTTVIAGSILQKKQAVKNTAKEILDDLRNIFIEQSSYGCDTNQHIGYYDYEIKLGLVVEQIDEYAKEKYGIEYGVEVE